MNERVHQRLRCAKLGVQVYFVRQMTHVASLRHSQHKTTGSPQSPRYTWRLAGQSSGMPRGPTKALKGGERLPARRELRERNPVQAATGAQGPAQSPGPLGAGRAALAERAGLQELRPKDWGGAGCWRRGHGDHFSTWDTPGTRARAPTVLHPPPLPLSHR